MTPNQGRENFDPKEGREIFFLMRNGKILRRKVKQMEERKTQAKHHEKKKGGGEAKKIKGEKRVWERRKKAKASVFGHTLYRFVEEENGSKDQRIKGNLEKRREARRSASQRESTHSPGCEHRFLCSSDPRFEALWV